MAFLELSFALGGLDPGQAEAACFATGALSVTFSDERDDAVYEPHPGEVRLWPRTRVQALYAADLAGPALLAALAGTLGLTPAALRASALADRIWEREWLRDFHAMRFGERLWISPRHEQVLSPGAVVVCLDPGLAFGTGTHASTALCLEWLDGAALAGRTLIDYGCGSGILAIAALRLGARSVSAYDIDPQALLATRENAMDNGVAADLRPCTTVAELPRECDVLLANILSEVLIGLCEDFARRVVPGGQLLLSGILEEQAGAVAARYAPWFDMKCCGQRAGWVALTGTRTAVVDG